MYSVRILPPAARYFKKIKDRRLKQLYKEAIDNLAADPFKGTQKTGDLRGIWGYDIYYNKTNYELAYTVFQDPDQIVVVILAGTRENFYQEPKRLL